MIKKINIITTKSDFSKILEKGCVVCANKDFKYLSVKDNYICTKCKSKYAVANRGVINTLLENENIRVRKDSTSLIDDVQVDRELEVKITKDNRPKIKIKRSNR